MAKIKNIMNPDCEKELCCYRTFPFKPQERVFSGVCLSHLKAFNYFRKLCGDLKLKQCDLQQNMRAKTWCVVSELLHMVSKHPGVLEKLICVFLEAKISYSDLLFAHPISKSFIEVPPRFLYQKLNTVITFCNLHRKTSSDLIRPDLVSDLNTEFLAKIIHEAGFSNCPPNLNALKQNSNCINFSDEEDSHSEESIENFRYSDDESCIKSPIKPHDMSIKNELTYSWIQSMSTSKFMELNSSWDENVFDDAINEQDFNSPDSKPITEQDCSSPDFKPKSRGSLRFWEDDSSSEEWDHFTDFSEIESPFTCIEIDSLEEEFANPTFGITFEELFDNFGQGSAIRSVNKNWQEMMQDVDAGPREATKVTFAPDSSLVSVQLFEKPSENSDDPDHSVLDQLHFLRRIENLSLILTPILAAEHRDKVLLSMGSYSN